MPWLHSVLPVPRAHTDPASPRSWVRRSRQSLRARASDALCSFSRPAGLDAPASPCSLRKQAKCASRSASSAATPLSCVLRSLSRCTTVLCTWRTCATTAFRCTSSPTGGTSVPSVAQARRPTRMKRPTISMHRLTETNGWGQRLGSSMSPPASP